VNTVEEAIRRVLQIKFIDRAACRSDVEQNFTVECMAKKYIQVYKSILEKKKYEDD
ncbi:MAG: mannose-6-phosphate isomerase, partial [Calditrichaeota bacterium]